MPNKTYMVALWFILFAGQAASQSLPEEFLRLTVSSLKCERGSTEPPDERFRTYIENTSPNQRISANVRANTVPADQTFTLLDSQLGAYIEAFPRFYEHRLAPGERRQIGCSRILRIASNDTDYVAVPIEYEVAGAVFVDPSEPVPPDEDALQFLSFDIKKLPDNKGCLSVNPGIYYIINLHPSRRISSEIDLIDNKGRPAGSLSVNLSPHGNNRLTCTQADIVNFTVSRVREAKFTTLP